MTRHKQEHFQDGWGTVPGLGAFYVACLHGKIVVARIRGIPYLIHPGRSSRATAKAMNRGLQQMGLTQYSVECVESVRHDDHQRRFLAVRVRGREEFTILEPGATEL